MQTDNRPQYTGRMERNPDGTITLWIEDSWKWRINITAERDPAGGYNLAGYLGETPKGLRIPLLDGEK